MPKRSVIVMKSVGPGDDDEGMPSLGDQREVAEVLARYNTAADGSPPRATSGVTVLHGPGMLVEMASGADEVRQLMVTMTDEDFAFPVLARMCREQKWTLLDPESGQRLRFGS